MIRVAVDTAPAAEPVSVFEAKAHLNVTHSEDDALIDDLITAARQHAERRTQRSFVTQTLTATFDIHEGRPPILLPRGPVESVTSFKYWDDDADGYSTTASTSYYLAGDDLALNFDDGATDWPTADRHYDAYTVTYVAGYGDAADVPYPIKQAILVLVADLYEYRGTAVGSGLVVTQTPVSAEMLLQQYVNYTHGG